MSDHFGQDHTENTLPKEDSLFIPPILEEDKFVSVAFFFLR